MYNPFGTSRPESDPEEDPIEWLSETRETAYPFEITSLTVALARLEGLSVRYVSGYKWDDFIANEGGAVLPMIQKVVLRLILIFWQICIHI